MVAAHPLLTSPLDIAREKAARGEGLTADEAALVKASADPAEVAEAEAFFGVPLEALLTNSDVRWEDERAFLLGEGPDPWPRSS